MSRPKYDNGTKTYEGTLTITWQERVSLGQGKTSVVTRTQTLVAHVTKPCPYFGKDTYIVYGNKAAPRLSFTRYDSDAEKLSEKNLINTLKRMPKLKSKKRKLKRRKQFTTFEIMNLKSYGVQKIVITKLSSGFYLRHLRQNNSLP